MSLPVVRTRCLLLRPWTRDDVGALHAMWNTPDVRRYLWDDLEIPFNTAEQIMESHLLTSARHGIGYWGLYAPQDAVEMAGFCGFRFIDDGSDIELMYGLLREYWGRGFATEACEAAISYLWRSTAFDVLYARTDPPNAASVRVMQRLGTQHESTTDAMITYVLRRAT